MFKQNSWLFGYVHGLVFPKYAKMTAVSFKSLNLKQG